MRPRYGEHTKSSQTGPRNQTSVPSLSAVKLAYNRFWFRITYVCIQHNSKIFPRLFFFSFPATRAFHRRVSGIESIAHEAQWKKHSTSTVQLIHGLPYPYLAWQTAGGQGVLDMLASRFFYHDHRLSHRCNAGTERRIATDDLSIKHPVLYTCASNNENNCSFSVYFPAVVYARTSIIS